METKTTFVLIIFFSVATLGFLAMSFCGGHMSAECFGAIVNGAGTQGSLSHIQMLEAFSTAVPIMYMTYVLLLLVLSVYASRIFFTASHTGTGASDLPQLRVIYAFDSPTFLHKRKLIRWLALQHRRGSYEYKWVHDIT